MEVLNGGGNHSASLINHNMSWLQAQTLKEKLKEWSKTDHRNLGVHKQNVSRKLADFEQCRSIVH